MDIKNANSKNASRLPFPDNWETGFKGRYRPACGGKEVPVYYPVTGWTLLAFDTLTCNRVMYIYKTDCFIDPSHL